MKYRIFEKGRLLNDFGELNESGYALRGLKEYNSRNARIKPLLRGSDFFWIRDDNFTLAIEIRESFGFTKLVVSLVDLSAPIQKSKSYTRLFSHCLLDDPNKGEFALSAGGAKFSAKYEIEEREEICEPESQEGEKRIHALNQFHYDDGVEIDYEEFLSIRSNLLNALTQREPAPLMLQHGIHSSLINASNFLSKQANKESGEEIKKQEGIEDKEQDGEEIKKQEGIEDKEQGGEDINKQEGIEDKGKGSESEEINKESGIEDKEQDGEEINKDQALNTNGEKAEESLEQSPNGEGEEVKPRVRKVKTFSKRIVMSIKGFNEQDLSLDVVLKSHTPDVSALISSSKNRYGFSYRQTAVGYSASGTVVLGDRQYVLEDKYNFAMFCWHRGSFKGAKRRIWAATGESVQKGSVSFSFTDGVDKTNENAVFFSGKGQQTDSISFETSRSKVLGLKFVMSKWKIKSNDGRVDLTFQPLIIQRIRGGRRITGYYDGGIILESNHYAEVKKLLGIIELK